MSSNSRIGAVQETSYTSLPIDIPDEFLAGPPPQPITLAHFSSSSLPEYSRLTAITLDNVLSLGECQELIALAERSCPPAAEPGESSSPWKPALVSVGPGMEAAAPGYRNSERVIWDRAEVVDRIWKRCVQMEGLEEMLKDVPNTRLYKSGRWKFRCLNERMRFLRYTPGMFFKPHYDSHYCTQMEGKDVETHYTLHLYLNDEGLVGGATGFLSRDRKRRYDVNPKAGRVLIFQHDYLLHEGAEVVEGVKYTMRTELMYTWEEDAAGGC